MSSPTFAFARIKKHLCLVQSLSTSKIFYIYNHHLTSFIQQSPSPPPNAHSSKPPYSDTNSSTSSVGPTKLPCTPTTSTSSNPSMRSTFGMKKITGPSSWLKTLCRAYACTWVRTSLYRIKIGIPVFQIGLSMWIGSTRALFVQI